MKNYFTLIFSFAMLFCWQNSWAQPANDDCTGAIAITIDGGLIPGTTVGTVPPDDPIGCASDYGVWYTVTGNGGDLIINSPTTFDHELDVFTASAGCGSTYTQIICRDGSVGTETYTIASSTMGLVYYIYVAHYSPTSTTTGTFDIEVTTPPTPPANDDCAGAANLPLSADATCGSAVSGTTNAATASSEADCSTTNKDVWYDFTPATTGGYYFSVTETFDSGFSSTYVSVFDGACGSLTQVGSLCFSSLLSDIPLTGGTTYKVNVRSTSTTGYVDFELCAYPAPPPPANDDCGGATPITVEVGTCSGWTMGTNVAATDSPEPFGGSCGGSTKGGDVWFSSTVPAGGAIELNRQNVSGISTLVVEVYTGTCGALVYQDCADFSYPLSISGLTPGDGLFFRFWDYSNNDDGTFEFCVGTPPPPPSNDACGGAISVGAGMGVATGSTAASSNVEGLTPCSGNTAPCATPGGGTGVIDFGAGLWYVYTSGAAEEFVVDTDGSTFDTEVQVFTGSCGALVCVGGDDDSGAGSQSSICITSTASFAPVDYYIYIDGHGTATGDFVLNITADPLPITLLSFEGEKMDKANKLSWITGSEANTEAHVIERSFDGNRWSEIGKVEASGYSSAEQSYEFVDQDPLAKSYYRLKSVDFDGSFQLSNVVTIEREVDGFSLSRVFPVPVSNDLNVEFNSDRNIDVDITITDLMGRVIHTDVFNAADGINNYQLNASDFASGVYFVSLSNGTAQLTQRIVKN